MAKHLAILKIFRVTGCWRKTANCVLVYGFNIPAIPVDTHVHRIFNTLGIIKTKDPYYRRDNIKNFG